MVGVRRVRKKVMNKNYYCNLDERFIERYTQTRIHLRCLKCIDQLHCQL